MPLIIDKLTISILINRLTSCNCHMCYVSCNIQYSGAPWSVGSAALETVTCRGSTKTSFHHRNMVNVLFITFLVLSDLFCDFKTLSDICTFFKSVSVEFFLPDVHISSICGSLDIRCRQLIFSYLGVSACRLPLAGSYSATSMWCRNFKYKPDLITRAKSGWALSGVGTW